MVLLNFALAPQNCARLHDALICLAKFSDTISIEARFGQLNLTALNSSKSAHASIKLTNPGFFLHYEFEPDLQRRDERFTCSFTNRALLSVFKGRAADGRGGEGVVERCEASFQDESNNVECRFVVKMFCRQGITKTYRLTYESAEVMQAIFEQKRAPNRWKIQARMLREYADYFGPKTEQLDICYDQEQVTLTSYTEKVMHGKEVLKQPLQTAVTIDPADFEEVSAQESLHITISVRDFRTIVAHADTLMGNVTALYSYPSQPLQFSYSTEGLLCEFTLMTIGDFRDSTAPNVSRRPTRDPQQRPTSFTTSADSSITPRVSRPLRAERSLGSQRPLGSRTAQASQQHELGQGSESLFVPADDDEQQWDPAELRDDDGDMLDWDASADNHATFHPTFRDDKLPSQQHISNNTGHGRDAGIAPTQRASQFRGMFDD